MFKMSSQIETIVNAYKTLAKIPSVLGGKLSKDGTKATAKWSVRNFDKGRTTKYMHNYVLDTAKEDISVLARSDFGIDVSNELLSAVSPSEAFRAVIREDRDGKDNKKQYMEVWSKNTLVHSVDLSALEVHGDVYTDSELGGLEWSSDETALVYVAEKKLKKSEPYIKRKAEEKNESEANLPKKGEEYIYRQDWGEQLVGRYLSVIVVFRLQNESLTVLQGLPDHWCPGQVRFTPKGDGVVGIALETEPRRLGLIFCTNRPGYIFQLTLDGVLTKISHEGMSVRSPRITPDGGLVWLQRKADGPHHACHELVRWKRDEGTQETLIPIVDTVRVIENGENFYGLYCQALPNPCFSADGKKLVFSTQQQNEVRVYMLDMESHLITDISNKSQPGSTTVLDLKSDVILGVCSNMTSPPQVYAAKLPSSGESIKWVKVSSSVEIPETLAKSKVEYLFLEHEGSQDSVKSFTVLYLSGGERNAPLVVWPHGGPHSGFVNAYSLEAALFNLLGFAAIQINYRGSTGAGDASVRFLPSRAGDADVKDCKLATDEAVRRYLLNDRALCLFGGSHGGFLVTHLSGQYPELYCAVVSRNPVVDVASMVGVTDIPDWCAVEAGFEYTESGPPSDEQLLAMRRCSPLAHVHSVRAPTALMLGNGDRRVPAAQGLVYARRLKANGVKTRIYMYDDNHSLSSLPAEMDNLINSADWLLTHLHKDA
ncbi:acylamino-acid-releasing enzyme-like [Epargyreus clarus]|uniref:acylamino-acid-releasing enzyme-like n=1 Tax=Epargyreus clarus TaxID=520877 RepID=UPI003C2FB4C6